MGKDGAITRRLPHTTASFLHYTLLTFSLASITKFCTTNSRQYTEVLHLPIVKELLPGEAWGDMADCGFLPLPIVCIQCGTDQNPCHIKVVGPTAGFIVAVCLAVVCWPAAIFCGCCATETGKK
ncbi:hypothetical protein BAUCODRAFT_38442 [Baudoinia panamericana UAMH 10762]|uniref:LITAF domain-containing protein n=1 Tax=Baudoinia panamericana (strain UAMH 10762) TaxID=717646 RepID=M2N180_BAUPA|nr:uncharacterized protein BAUCODRAFT_38442 [Baudoinia panamericana UAMH 10762]EMC92390.1 hypothetical protein BAUCODRAFT_38442 [Baudoinia panamericana UAMH 10762]